MAAPNLDLLRLAVGTLLLAYASVLDIRTRRVPNRTWIVGGSVALILLVLDLAWTKRVEWLDVLLAALFIAFAYGLWFFHLLAGGADAKALMTLAILVPIPIELQVAGSDLPLWGSLLPGVLVVFANSLLAFVALPFFFFLGNALLGHFRLPAMFLGYPMPIDRVRKSFVWLAERVDDEGHFRQLIWGSRLTRDEQEEQLGRLANAGRKRVWVTPKIPYMVPLLAGFVAAFTLGDVFSKLVFEYLQGRLG